jgi:ethanolamine utilization protein EutN
MRIARVIGVVTLNRQIPELMPGRYLLVRTCGRKTLAGLDAGNDETLVLYDDLSASPGDLVGLVEGREAAVPFGPKKVPYDSYNACILDEVNFTPSEVER